MEANAAAPAVAGGGAFAYEVAPEPIDRILEAPASPLVLPAPGVERVAILSRPGLPSIAELAEPVLRLAGITINPQSSGPQSTGAFDRISFLAVESGREVRVQLPPGSRLIAPTWSSDGRRLAFLMLGEENVALWTADAHDGTARPVAQGVNAAFARPYDWLPDSSGLLVRLVPEGRGAPPEPPSLPAGPIVREAGIAPASPRTLPNLLSGPHEEALFEHHAASRLAIADAAGGAVERFGDEAIITQASISPDGRYVLLHRLKRPFSYSGNWSSFPTEILVMDRRGEVVRRIADLPAGESLASGPRMVGWRADAPATLIWAEAAEGGGGEESAAPIRDRLFRLEAPFDGRPERFVALEQRFSGILWGRPDFALVLSISPEERREYRIAIDPSRGEPGRLLQTRAFRGGAAAGTPLLRTDPRGRELLRFTSDGRAVLVRVPGGLGRLDLVTGEVIPLWREQSGESLLALSDERRLLTWREDAASPPNLFTVDAEDGPARQLTSFADPAPEFAAVRRRVLSYSREDGVPLSGTLHLPPGYEEASGERLPVLVWAYPVSVGSVDDLGRRTAQPNRFLRPQGFGDLPLLLLTQGYAVFEAAMPIVGRDGAEPNDSHVEQLRANAEAAVEALVRSGMADRDRIAVGGWSYGAAMTANLLAHTDLFRTGIALSGAYNRTLTPFGFQASERRSFWEAPDAYLAMSPFVHADQIDEPILLFHGLADQNSGTFPMQSERFFAALEANSATARLVMLPFEDHGYRARESLNHVLWEIVRWLDVHLAPQEEPSEARRLGAASRNAVGRP